MFKNRLRTVKIDHNLATVPYGLIDVLLMLLQLLVSVYIHIYIKKVKTTNIPKCPPVNSGWQLIVLGGTYQILRALEYLTILARGKERSKSPKYVRRAPKTAFNCRLLSK